MADLFRRVRVRVDHIDLTVRVASAATNQSSSVQRVAASSPLSISYPPNRPSQFSQQLQTSESVGSRSYFLKLMLVRGQRDGRIFFFVFDPSYHLD